MQKSISIIIPVYNEERRIGRTLIELFDFLKKAGDRCGGYRS
jgi:glycosyltransferase involved in cell wall biosynthesis